MTSFRLNKPKNTGTTEAIKFWSNRYWITWYYWCQCRVHLNDILWSLCSYVENPLMSTSKLWYCLDPSSLHYPLSDYILLLSYHVHWPSITWWFCHLWKEGNVPGFSAWAIGFCLFFLRFLNFSSSRIQVRETGRLNRRCILLS